jgi:hypothetical protein
MSTSSHFKSRQDWKSRLQMVDRVMFHAALEALDVKLFVASAAEGFMRPHFMYSRLLDVTLHPITSKREGGMVTPTIFFPSQPQSRRNSNTSKLWTAIQLRVLSSGEKRHLQLLSLEKGW